MKKVDNMSKRRRWIISIAIIAIAALLLPVVLYDLYVGGSAYRKAKRGCGTDQLIYAYTIPKDPRVRYVKPTDSDYSVPWPNAEYFCTEQDAIDAGYTPLYDDEGYYNE